FHPGRPDSPGHPVSGCARSRRRDADKAIRPSPRGDGEPWGAWTSDGRPSWVAYAYFRRTPIIGPRAVLSTSKNRCGRGGLPRRIPGEPSSRGSLLVVVAHRHASVGGGAAGADGGGEEDRLGHLLLGSAGLLRVPRVDLDAVRTLGRVGDGHRDQLAELVGDLSVLPA